MSTYDIASRRRRAGRPGDRHVRRPARPRRRRLRGRGLRRPAHKPVSHQAGEQLPGAAGRCRRGSSPCASRSRRSSSARSCASGAPSRTSDRTTVAASCCAATLREDEARTLVLALGPRPLHAAAPRPRRRGALPRQGPRVPAAAARGGARASAPSWSAAATPRSTRRSRCARSPTSPWCGGATSSAPSRTRRTGSRRPASTWSATVRSSASRGRERLESVVVQAAGRVRRSSCPPTSCWSASARSPTSPAYAHWGLGLDGTQDRRRLVHGDEHPRRVRRRRLRQPTPARCG